MRAALRVVVIVAALAVPFPAVPAATAKSYALPAADVRIAVQRDGSLVVTERLTFRFDGAFRGAYRLIPVPASRGQSIGAVEVSENGRPYRSGGGSEIGVDDEPGLFGVAHTGDWTRVVWHFDARDEERVFTVGYRLRGVSQAYDDIVDLYVQPWGSQWRAPLDRLSVRVTLPRAVREGERERLRVWGHPASVVGETRLQRDGATLGARDVPAGQFVELRLAFPRSVLRSAKGAQRLPGKGLAGIVAEQEQEFASSSYGVPPDAASAAAPEEAGGGEEEEGGWPSKLLFLLLAPFLLLARLFGFGGRGDRDADRSRYDDDDPGFGFGGGSSGGGARSGGGGSFGGGGGRGSGGGGGGAW